MIKNYNKTTLDLVLYSKSNFQNSFDIFDDMNKILSKGYELDKDEILFHVIEKLSPFVNKSPFDFISNVCEQNCWKYGYYTKNQNRKNVEVAYDLKEASLRYFLSEIRFLDLKFDNFNFADVILFYKENKLNPLPWKKTKENPTFNCDLYLSKFTNSDLNLSLVSGTYFMEVFLYELQKEISVKIIVDSILKCGEISNVKIEFIDKQYLECLIGSKFSIKYKSDLIVGHGILTS